MKITQGIAQNVAEKMVQKKRTEREKLYVELRKIVTEYASGKIPKEVLKTFKNHASYFEPKGYIYFVGNGFQYVSLGINGSLPLGNNNKFTPDDAISKPVRLLLDKIKDKTKEIDELYSEIKNALLHFRTYAKVQSEFKEAAIHLPKIQCEAVIINIEKIREKL